MLISLILFVIVAILATYVATTNLAIMQLNVLGYPIQATTGVLVVSALALGFLFGLLFLLPALVSRSWSLIRHRRKLQDLQDAMQRKGAANEPEDE